MFLRRSSILTFCLLALGGTLALTRVDANSKLHSSALAENPSQEMPLQEGEQKFKFLEQLNLTEAQNQQLQAIHRQNHEEMIQLHRSLGQEKQTLEEMMVGTASANEIRSQYQEVKALSEQLADLRFTTMLDMREVLTPEQRQEFASLMEEKRQEFGDR